MKRSRPDQSSKQTRRLRLLLHAADGCVPFLTPGVLETHFPPSDDLWIGIAVRDTCVVPSYEAKHKNKKDKTKRSSYRTADDSSTLKKPRGYTFVSTPPDPWLLPYSRVTVPSFDWMQDNTEKKLEKRQELTCGSTGTNQHVLVWTAHGRQKLTAEQYAKASLGLKSHFTLSLYDMYEDSAAKRQEKANSRNKEWFKDLLQRRSEPTSSDDCLWSPVLLPREGVGISSMKIAMSHESDEDIAGIALIGKWRPGLEKVLIDYLPSVPQVAILATYSLKEVLEIACTNLVDTIGTDLPTRWAKNKLALAVEVSENQREGEMKRRKADEQEDASVPTLDYDGCLDITDTIFARDPRPLAPRCQCLACKDDKFSRAYIHHLIRAKELLADILLFGHNLHHLLKMIRAFNTSDDRGKLKEAISSQLATTPEEHISKM